jgi:hypothetical protein
MEPLTITMFPFCCMIESVKLVPPSVHKGTYAEVPVPVTKPDPEDSIVTELALKEIVTPEPALILLYVNPVPPELEERNAFGALIAVRPVPPETMGVTLRALQAVPSNLQVFALSVKIWFKDGDGGKLSAIIFLKRGSIYLFCMNLIKYFL